MGVFSSKKKQDSSPPPPPLPHQPPQPDEPHQTLDEPTQGFHGSTRHKHLEETRLFELLWLLIHVGTSVLQKCFDDLICNDFSEYLTANEAEMITLHWLIDTRRINRFYVDRVYFKYHKTRPFELQSPLDYVKMHTSIDSTKFDIKLLYVLLRYVCGLRAPNDEVWMKPLPEDMSMEADISRLTECRNIVHINFYKFNVDDKMIDEQMKKLTEILTRLDPNVDIKDDIPFDVDLHCSYEETLREWFVQDLFHEHERPISFESIDDDAWINDEVTVSKLLHEERLPNIKQLNRICEKFQSNSFTVRKVCGYICNTIQMTSKHIKRCWPAYVHDKTHEANRNLVTFVAEKDTNIVLNIKRTFRNNILVYEHFNDSHSAESTEMMEHDMKHTSRLNNNLEECLRKHSLSLMRLHSNITLIAGSSVKSTGYTKQENKKDGSERDGKIMKPCIVIYVQNKGYIPLGEEPFPTQLDEFDTDVRECVVSLFTNRESYQRHEHLLMGTSVRKRDCFDAGTLGGFLEHSEHHLCGLTCAHVVFDKRQHRHIFDIKHWSPGKGNKVVQPATLGGDEIGEVVCALLRQDEPVGIDIALVKIQARPPITGQFAIEGNCNKHYNSGKTLDWKNLQGGAKLIKFGSETGQTTTDYQFLGTGTLRYGSVILPHQLIVHNTSSQSVPFAAPGDSGSLCFVEDLQGLRAIGIVVGGSGDLNNCFLTPIHDILNALEENNTKQVRMNTFPEHEPMEH